MLIRVLVCSFMLGAGVSGCASVASSSAPYVAQSEQTTGQVFVTAQAIPEGAGFSVVGHVKANARQGYDSVESLYPLLAEEAKKVGANAVINVKGGRTVTAFSWSAPFVSGTAVKIDDPTKLAEYVGQYF